MKVISSSGIFKTIHDNSSYLLLLRKTKLQSFEILFMYNSSYFEISASLF